MVNLTDGVAIRGWGTSAAAPTAGIKMGATTPESDGDHIAVFDGEAQIAQLQVALAGLAQPRVLLAAAVQGGQVVEAVEAEALG